MSKCDFIHVAVREALENDGWDITNDPYIIGLEFEKSHFAVDLGASKIINAFKGEEKVLVEVKSLSKDSIISDFHTVLGQFINYKDAIKLGNIQRKLYLGVSEKGYEKLVSSPFINMQIERYSLKFVVINTENKIVLEWIN